MKIEFLSRLVINRENAEKKNWFFHWWDLGLDDPNGKQKLILGLVKLVWWWMKDDEYMIYMKCTLIVWSRRYGGFEACSHYAGRRGSPSWPMFSGDGKITEPLCMFNVSSPICHYAAESLGRKFEAGRRTLAATPFAIDGRSDESFGCVRHPLGVRCAVAICHKMCSASFTCRRPFWRSEPTSARRILKSSWRSSI